MSTAKYFGSTLPEEVAGPLFAYAADYGNGILHTDDGWHFVTEDQDTYGPYDTEEECSTAQVEYARSL